MAAGQLDKVLTILNQQFCSQEPSSVADQQTGQLPGVPGQQSSALEQQPSVRDQQMSVPEQQAGVLGQQLGLPHQTWPQLCSAVHETRDEKLIQRLEVCQTSSRVRDMLVIKIT